MAVGAQLGSSRYAWDGPLRIAIKLNQQVFIQSMAQAAPVGMHEHDKISGRYVDKRVKYPRVGTRLKAALGDRGIGKWNIFYDANGSFVRASISIFLPYARIIDQGGEIPPVYPVASLRYTKKTQKARYRVRMMHFAGADGDKYTMQRRGYTIKGQDYVSRGFNDYCNKTGNAGGLKIGWINGSNAAYGGIH